MLIMDNDSVSLEQHIGLAEFHTLAEVEEMSMMPSSNCSAVPRAHAQRSQGLRFHFILSWFWPLLFLLELLARTRGAASSSLCSV